jgi:hypothetical protein
MTVGSLALRRAKKRCEFIPGIRAWYALPWTESGLAPALESAIAIANYAAREGGELSTQRAFVRDGVCCLDIVTLDFSVIAGDFPGREALIAAIRAADTFSVQLDDETSLVSHDPEEADWGIRCTFTFKIC